MNTNLINIIEFVVSLSVIITLHEMGHFLVGKLCKIEAEEFGFGYPPRMVKLFKVAGTDITLNWIPFGAFVRFKGELEKTEPDVKNPGDFISANKWSRLGTLLAGPAMNFLLGILLFSIVISQAGYPKENIVQIAGVASGSPAYEAGIQVDDQLLSINGQPIENMQSVSAIIQENLEQTVEIQVMRADETITSSMVPRENPPEGEGALGIIMQNPVEKIGFLKAIPYSGQLAGQQIQQLVSLPAMLLRGQVQSEEMRLLSPKGIYDVYSQVREEERESEAGQPSLAFLNIAWFFGTISIAFGFSNLLPIPALDGGRILFILPEIFLGKRVPPKYENMIHMIGYTALLMLMFYVFYQDIVNPIVLP